MGAVLAAVIIAAGLVVAFQTNVFTPSHPTPSVVNQPLAQARASVDKVHMTLKQGAPVKSITVAPGDVVSQSPKPGVSQKEGSTVTVVLSAGKPDVTVPSLAGMTCAQATTALQSAHFLSVCAPGTYNNTVPAQVLVLWSIDSTQNPTTAPYGSTITLVPSLGHEPATVPAIPTSYTFDQAQAALQAVGLTATQNTETSTTVPAGQVISTPPASGAQAPYGSTVTVNVSTGPPTTRSPTSSATRWRRPPASCRRTGSASRVCRGVPATWSAAPSPPSGRPCRSARPSRSSPTSSAGGAPVRSRL